MTADSSRDTLMRLGLTEVESDTYIYLIRNSPATGYQIAKATGKPTPNTYKALKTLQDRGAIIVENGQSKLCRAIPPEEFLVGLERRFSHLKATAARHLARLSQAPDDEGVYHLHSSVQVYERIRRMLASCEKVALLDLFPNAVVELAPSMQAASSRGIIVCAKVYSPSSTLIHDQGFIAVHDPDGEQTIKRWQGVWANIVVDGRQHLISYMSPDGQRVHQAVWSACTFASWVYHSALRSELLYKLITDPNRGKENESAFAEAYSQLCHTALLNAPGYQVLLNRYAQPRGLD